MIGRTANTIIRKTTLENKSITFVTWLVSLVVDHKLAAYFNNQFKELQH